MVVPVVLQPIGARLLVGQQRLLAPRLVALANLLLRLAVAAIEGVAALGVDQAGHDVHDARGVEHVDDRRRDSSGAILTAVCWRLVVAPPISSGSVIFRRSISRATITISSSDGVIRPLRPTMSGVPLDRRVENLRRGHHHAEVDHLVVVAAEHHADDVLADVVDVPLDRRHDDPALRAAGVGIGLEPPACALLP